MSKYALPLVLALFVGCKADSTDDSDPGVGDLNNISTSERPSKRSEILAAANESSNEIMIFGGNDGPVVNQIPTARFLNETWIFEPGYGWTEIATEEQPKKRGRYAMSMDQAGNRALFFGGRFRREGESGAYEIFDDLWEFSFDTHEWTLLDEGGGPAARYYPASGYDEESGTFYIWGGNLNSDPLNFIRGTDLWSYKDGQWTEIPTSGEQPDPMRVFFGSTFDTKRKRIILFGGHPGDFVSQAFKETYALDVETGVWERLHGGVQAPSTRMHAHLTYDEAEDRYLLFGGHTDVGDQNDLWWFDTTENRWNELHIADVLNSTGLGCMGNSSEVPADYVTQDLSAPERRHRGMFAMMHDNLWIYGGIHAECSDQVNDTWRYDLAEGQWHELIESTTGESCARRGDDCQCLCL
jgi:hypothetical protein